MNTGRGRLLIRARSCVAARPIEYLPDGTYLAQMNLARQKGAANAAAHPSMLATELLMERSPKELLLRREPTAQFVAPPVYMHGASLLYEALEGSAELTPALDLPELHSIGRDVYALLEEQMSRRLPNWQELLPSEAFDQT